MDEPCVVRPGGRDRLAIHTGGQCAQTWDRPRRVKSLYDPNEVIRGNHHIPPA
jgi:hypothetical protein